MKRFELAPDARADLEQAIDWYRGQRPGLDRALSAEIDRVFASIADNPRAFPILYRGVRRALTRRFPYKVLFDEREDMIVILAIRHQSRRPQRHLEGP